MSSPGPPVPVSSVQIQQRKIFGANRRSSPALDQVRIRVANVFTHLVEFIEGNPKTGPNGSIGQEKLDIVLALAVAASLLPFTPFRAENIGKRCRFRTRDTEVFRQIIWSE